MSRVQTIFSFKNKRILINQDPKIKGRLIVIKIETIGSNAALEISAFAAK